MYQVARSGLASYAPKSNFCGIKMEYIKFIFTRTDIKPQPNKVQAILVISPPKQVKYFCRFLGMVQYYRDLWARCS